jgi:prevent-host-death family protein
MADPVRTIPQRELRNSISAVLREVEAGGAVRVTVAGRPVADIVPIRSPRYFVSRSVVERIIHDSPLDADFKRDIKAALDHEIPERFGHG